MLRILIFVHPVAKSNDARRENLEKSVCIALGRVRYYTKTFSELQINDILFPLSFDLGEIGMFWRYFHCSWLEDQERGSA